MKSSLLVSTLILAASLAVPAYPQVGQDLKNAGQDTKTAAKNGAEKTKTATQKAAHTTTRGVKKGATKSTHAVKSGIHKTATKVSDKTQTTPQ